MTGLYRQTDPETSVEAAEIITASGKRKNLKDQCLQYILEHPDETAGEIGEGTSLGHDRVWRRLSDLKNDGIIIMGESRVWNGRSQRTWRVVLDDAPVQATMDLGVISPAPETFRWH